MNTEAAGLSQERVSFSFGANWARFIEGLTEDRLRAAHDALLSSLDLSDLRGRSFLDIGCGSGLFSLAAFALGAKTVTSVDVDPVSVDCTKKLREAVGSPATWAVVGRSIFDDELLASIPPHSVVYSWGALHHTGDVETAVRRTLSFVAPGGRACIALYNMPPAPRLQMGLKRAYARTPRAIRPVFVGAYAGAWLSAYGAKKRRSPLAFVRSYSREFRGMSYWRDAVDWLGGLPCQFVEPAEFEAMVDEREFTVDRIAVAPRGGNNEYLLRRLR